MKHTLIFPIITTVAANSAPKGGPVWTDPDTSAKENADFLVQGEYRRADTA